MNWPGFKRDPIREELRRLNRESSRLGRTARRLVEDSVQVSPPQGGECFSPAHRPHQTRKEPVLRVEGRVARRKVLIAAALAGTLAFFLFRLVAGWAR